MHIRIKFNTMNVENIFQLLVNWEKILVSFLDTHIESLNEYFLLL